MSTSSKTSLKLFIDLKKIPFDRYRKDFTFIVNGEEYPTHRIIADLLSPKVRQFHFIDETVDTFTITTNEKCDFNSIILFAITGEIQISKDELTNYCSIFMQLGNKDAFLQLIPQYDEKITIDNVFDSIKNKIHHISQFNESLKNFDKIWL